MINVIVFIQVICLELRGPGSLSIGASNAGPVVGTSKDQHQVNMMKRNNTTGSRMEVRTFLSRQSLICRASGAWQRCRWAFELIPTSWIGFPWLWSGLLIGRVKLFELILNLMFTIWRDFLAIQLPKINSDDIHKVSLIQVEFRTKTRKTKWGF